MKRVMSGWYGWYYRYSLTIPLMFRTKRKESEQIAKDINVRSKDEPQTEDEILREQCRAFMDIVEQTERED